MLEDDLRYRPVDTTNYFYKLLARRYQKTFRMNALFTAIAEAFDILAECHTSLTLEYRRVGVDWLGHRLHLTVFPLKSWDSHLVEGWMQDRYGSITMNPFDWALTPVRPRERGTMDRIIQLLDHWAEHGDQFYPVCRRSSHRCFSYS
jgi:hypothetical protein